MGAYLRGVDSDDNVFHGAAAEKEAHVAGRGDKGALVWRLRLEHRNSVRPHRINLHLPSHNVKAATAKLEF